MSLDTKISIIVVDDDPDILNYFRAIIKDPRFQLTLTNSGRKAIEKAAQQDYHIAFMDINMPGMTGLETLFAWKKIHPKTAVVIISSYNDGHLVREAIDSGAFTYLFKPLNKMDILAVIVRALKSLGIESPGKL